MLSSERADHSWSFARSTSGGRDGFSFSDILTGYGVVLPGASFGEAPDGSVVGRAGAMQNSCGPETGVLTADIPNRYESMRVALAAKFAARVPQDRWNGDTDTSTCRGARP